MLSYIEVMERLSEMRDRFDAGFSSSDRLFINDMSVVVLSKCVRNTACGDCYRDAYLEIYHKLKMLGTMPKEKKFVLRAGVLLHFNGKMYVNENLTDDIAVAAISDNAGRKDLFQKFPDNLDELIAANRAMVAKEAEMEEADKEELRKQVAGLKSENERLNKELSDARAAWDEYNKEMEKLRSQLQAESEKVKALEKSIADNGSEAPSDAEKPTVAPSEQAAAAETKTEKKTTAKSAEAKK